jgi:hypothetical protein
MLMKTVQSAEGIFRDGCELSPAAAKCPTTLKERDRMKRRKVVSVSEVLILFFGGQFGIWTDYCFREVRFHQFANHVLAAALLSALIVGLTIRPQSPLLGTPAMSPSQSLCLRFLGIFALGFAAAFCLNYPPGHHYEPTGVLLSTMLITIVVTVVAATAFGFRYERK